MENASKALLMAAGILIAMLVLSVGVILVGNFGKTADSYVTKLDTVELRKYNSNFDIYIGRKDVTAQEIVTLIGVVQETNQNTKIYIGNAEVSNYTEQQKNEFLSDNILKYTIDPSTGQEVASNLYKYVEDSIRYNEDGKIIEIKFAKK